jgi:hypothetical protein
VTNQMRRPVAKRLKPIQRRFNRCPFVNQRPLFPDCGKSEQPRRLRIDLQID